MAGLKQNLEAKLAGIKGDFEHLLVRTRFEKAKISRDLSSQNDQCFSGGNSSNTGPKRSIASRQQGKPIPGGQSNLREEADHYFTCHEIGHYAKNCPYKGRSALGKTQG